MQIFFLGYEFYRKHFSLDQHVLSRAFSPEAFFRRRFGHSLAWPRPLSPLQSDDFDFRLRALRVFCFFFSWDGSTGVSQIKKILKNVKSIIICQQKKKTESTRFPSRVYRRTNHTTLTFVFYVCICALWNSTDFFASPVRGTLHCRLIVNAHSTNTGVLVMILMTAVGVVFLIFTCSALCYRHVVVYKKNPCFCFRLVESSVF